MKLTYPLPIPDASGHLLQMSLEKFSIDANFDAHAEHGEHGRAKKNIMTPTRKAQYLVQRLPFILLALKAVWAILEPFGFQIGKYWFASEIQAHSLAFCFVLGYYAYIGRHCLYLKVCVAGLASLNLLNIAYYFRIIDRFYLNAYTGLVFATCFTFALIHAVRNLR